MRDRSGLPQLVPPSPGRRVAAVVALAGGVAVVVVATGFVVRNPVLLVGGVVGAALAVGGTAYACTHRAVARAGAMVVASVGAALAITALLFVRPGLVVALVGLLLVTGSCARAALTRPAAALAARPTPGVPVAAARQPVLLCNPRSGDGTADEVDLVAEARGRGIHVVELEEGSDLAALTRDALRAGADVVGMAGGDGSLGLVAGLAAEHDAGFVVVPAGTRNHFALDLGLDRDDPIGALDAFGAAYEERVDLGIVNDRPFVNNVSLGAYGEVVADDDYRDAKLRTALTRLPAVVAADAPAFALHFTDGDGREHDAARVVLVSNNPYTLDSGAGLGSRPSLTGAVLGVFVLPVEADVSRLEWSTPELVVDAEEATVDAGLDGEAVELTAPLRFRIEPGALRVRRAAAAIGYSPAAIAAALGANPLTRLLRTAAGRP